MDINNQTASGNSTINNIETQINNYAQRKLPKKYLTDSPSRVNKAQFLYRDSQINELKKKIKSGENLALISGFGGIGKTAIARALYHELEKEYEHIAWINYTGNLKQSVLTQVNLCSDEKNQDERWGQIKHYFTNCEDRLLFFVDNISQETDIDLQWMTGLKAHLFITSRLATIRNFEPYEIEFLSEKQSIDVFYSYYKYDKNQGEKETVIQLVDLVSCHTLSIELLAGVANTTKYRNNLKQFLEVLREKGFGFPDLKTNSSHSPIDATISEHLAKLFEIADLNDEQLRILANFQIIPKGLQVPREFSDWIGCEPNALEDLVKSRWISFSDTRYVMYDIVWEAVKLQLSDIPYKYVEEMIKTMAFNDYFNANDRHLPSTNKLQIAEAYASAKHFSDMEAVEWAVFLSSLGTQYKNKGEYDNALVYNKKALPIVEKYTGKDHPITAKIYNNIGLVYQYMKENDKAFKYLKKALDIYEKVLGKNNPDTATTYNNIGLVYESKGEYDNALEYFTRALDFFETEREKYQSFIGTIYANIGVVYKDKGECNRALEYLKKALDIQKTVSRKDHPSTATTYNNIGLVYKEKGEPDNALEYFQKALDIQEMILGKNHPNTATTYNNMADVHKDTGEYDKAFKYSQKTSKRESENITVVRATPKVGRNDRCPCGSGKKYKQCCGG